MRLQWTSVSSRSNTSEYSWARRVLSGSRGRDSSKGNSRSKSGGRSRRNAKGSWPSCKALTTAEGVSGSELVALCSIAAPVSYEGIGEVIVGSVAVVLTDSLLLFSTPSDSTISACAEFEFGFRSCSKSRFKLKVYTRDNHLLHLIDFTK